MIAEDSAAIEAYAKDIYRSNPRQEEGKQGGYSEDEMREIEVMVSAQCDELKELVKGWSRTVIALQEEQERSAQALTEFSVKYDAKVLELSLSEGLGQKYGAPRRRAQAKLRTEVTRDDRSAGKVDELLAQLEYLCAEQRRKLEYSTGADAPNESEGGEGYAAPAPLKAGTDKDDNNVDGVKGIVPHGRAEQDKANEIWALAVKIRGALHERCHYLQALSPLGSKVVSSNSIPWLASDRIPVLINKEGEQVIQGKRDFPTAALTVETESQSAQAKSATVAAPRPGSPEVSASAGGAGGVTSSSNPLTFAEAVEDAMVVCRKETKELYATVSVGAPVPEGKEAKGAAAAAAANKDTLESNGSIPNSLEIWLRDNKEKLVGAGGHLEKASQRLWHQVGRLEILLNRRLGTHVQAEGGESDDELGSEADDGDSVKPRERPTRQRGAHLISVRLVTLAHLGFLKQQRDLRDGKVSKVLAVLEKVRVVNERSLRPRLGSPDSEAVAELAAILDKEQRRSQDVQDTVTRFRSTFIKYVVELARNAFEDIVQCTQSCMSYLDSCVHQALMTIPAGCALPRKRMTAKRLKKAQRIRSAVETGAEDRSKERRWPSIAVERFARAVADIESIVVSAPSPLDANVSHSSAASGPPPLGRKATIKGLSALKKANTARSEDELHQTLLSNDWLERIRQNSAIRSYVSSAHRALIEERNSCVEQLTDEVVTILVEVKEKYTRLLLIEEGWTERWRRQVRNLRQESY